MWHFYYFNFESNHEVLKSELTLFVERKYKNVDANENGKSYRYFWRDEPCTSAHIRIVN